MSRRFCLTLDLKNEPKLIAEYKRHHEKIWPEITQSIKGKVQEWEELMWKFQKPLPQAKRGEKWLRMERIFKLES